MTVFPRSVANRRAEDLTPKEARVLDFIVACHDQHDRFPNLRQIRDTLAYSLAAVRHHLDKLEKKGWLECSRENFLARIESALRSVTPSVNESGYGADPHRGPVPLHSAAQIEA